MILTESRLLHRNRALSALFQGINRSLRGIFNCRDFVPFRFIAILNRVSGGSRLATAKILFYARGDTII